VAKMSSNALNRYMRWIVLLFIAYALWHSTFSTRGLSPESPHPSSGQASTGIKDKDCNAPDLLGDFSALALTILPTYSPEIHAKDIKAGEGEPAQCGQHATVQYEYALKDGTIIFSNMSDKEGAGVNIGSNTMLPGLERGIIGMKPGAEREVLIPPSLAFDAVKESITKIPPAKLTGQTIHAKIALLALSSDVAKSSMPLRFVNTAQGGGVLAQCGDRVRINITLWKMDGTKLFSTLDKGEPVSFILGQSEVPYGVELGIQGMREHGQRTLIIPPAYTARLHVSAQPDPSLAAISLPANETVLAEVALISSALKMPAISTATPKITP